MILPLILLHQVVRQPLDFAFFGCNRISDADELAQKAANPSTANVPELKANFRDAQVAGVKFVFALGDIVNGYGDDKGEKLKGQLDAWPPLVTVTPDVTVLPVPGNHELNRKHNKKKLANPATDQVWNDWMKANGYDRFAGNGPTPASDPADKLATDQSRLNYSFNVGTTHFIVVNTDTRTTEPMDGEPGETKVGWIPVEWIKKDLAEAEANPAVADTFILGHRNLVDPVEATEDAPIEPGCAGRLVDALKATKKVRAYLCAHVHDYEIQKVKATGVYQIVVGNGGSDLNKEWKPSPGTWFGFGVIRVHADGKVGLVLYKRPLTPGGPGAVAPVSKASPEIILNSSSQ